MLHFILVLHLYTKISFRQAFVFTYASTPTPWAECRQPMEVDADAAATRTQPHVKTWQGCGRVALNSVRSGTCIHFHMPRENCCVCENKQYVWQHPAERGLTVILSSIHSLTWYTSVCSWTETTHGITKCPEESYKAILDNKKRMQYFVIRENTR